MIFSQFLHNKQYIGLSLHLGRSFSGNYKEENVVVLQLMTRRVHHAPCRREGLPS